MKKIFIVCLWNLPFLAFSQQKLRQNIEVETVKGKTVLTITSIGPDGKEKKEVYKGEEADLKLAELEGKNPNNTTLNVKEEYKIEFVDGVKVLKIVKVKNGVESVEEYKGEDAEKKMKELGIEEDKKTMKKVN